MLALINSIAFFKNFYESEALKVSSSFYLFQGFDLFVPFFRIRRGGEGGMEASFLKFLRLKTIKTPI